jgi:hypothetical protein
VRVQFTLRQIAVCLAGAATLLHTAGCTVPAWVGPAVEVGNAATRKVGTNEPIVHRVEPQLRVSDSQLDFGKIAIATRALRQLEVRNISRFDLKILTARSHGSCFAVVAAAPFPITLTPNEAITLEVAMSNHLAARCDGRLEINTDSATAALVTIRLKGLISNVLSRIAVPSSGPA